MEVTRELLEEIKTEVRKEEAEGADKHEQLKQDKSENDAKDEASVATFAASPPLGAVAAWADKDNLMYRSTDSDCLNALDALKSALSGHNSSELSFEGRGNTENFENIDPFKDPWNNMDHTEPWGKKIDRNFGDDFNTHLTDSMRREETEDAEKQEPLKQDPSLNEASVATSAVSPPLGAVAAWADKGDPMYRSTDSDCLNALDALKSALLGHNSSELSFEGRGNTENFENIDPFKDPWNNMDHTEPWDTKVNMNFGDDFNTCLTDGKMRREETAGADKHEQLKQDNIIDAKDEESVATFAASPPLGAVAAWADKDNLMYRSTDSDCLNALDALKNALLDHNSSEISIEDTGNSDIFESIDPFKYPWRNTDGTEPCGTKVDINIGDDCNTSFTDSRMKNKLDFGGDFNTDFVSSRTKDQLAFGNDFNRDFLNLELVNSASHSADVGKTDMEFNSDFMTDFADSGRNLKLQDPVISSEMDLNLQDPFVSSELNLDLQVPFASSEPNQHMSDRTNSNTNQCQQEKDKFLIRARDTKEQENGICSGLQPSIGNLEIVSSPASMYSNADDNSSDEYQDSAAEADDAEEVINQEDAELSSDDEVLETFQNSSKTDKFDSGYEKENKSLHVYGNNSTQENYKAFDMNEKDEHLDLLQCNVQTFSAMSHDAENASDPVTTGSDFNKASDAMTITGNKIMKTATTKVQGGMFYDDDDDGDDDDDDDNNDAVDEEPAPDELQDNTLASFSDAQLQDSDEEEREVFTEPQDNLKESFREKLIQKSIDKHDTDVTLVENRLDAITVVTGKVHTENKTDTLNEVATLTAASENELQDDLESELLSLLPEDGFNMTDDAKQDIFNENIHLVTHPVIEVQGVGEPNMRLTDAQDVTDSQPFQLKKIIPAPLFNDSDDEQNDDFGMTPFALENIQKDVLQESQNSFISESSESETDVKATSYSYYSENSFTNMNDIINKVESGEVQESNIENMKQEARFDSDFNTRNAELDFSEPSIKTDGQDKLYVENMSDDVVDVNVNDTWGKSDPKKLTEIEIKDENLQAVSLQANSLQANSLQVDLFVGSEELICDGNRDILHDKKQIFELKTNMESKEVLDSRETGITEFNDINIETVLKRTDILSTNLQSQNSVFTGSPENDPSLTLRDIDFNIATNDNPLTDDNILYHADSMNEINSKLLAQPEDHNSLSCFKNEPKFLQDLQSEETDLEMKSYFNTEEDMINVDSNVDETIELEFTDVDFAQGGATQNIILTDYQGLENSSSDFETLDASLRITSLVSQKSQDDTDFEDFEKLPPYKLTSGGKSSEVLISVHSLMNQHKTSQDGTTLPKDTSNGENFVNHKKVAPMQRQYSGPAVLPIDEVQRDAATSGPLPRGLSISTDDDVTEWDQVQTIVPGIATSEVSAQGREEAKRSSNLIDFPETLQHFNNADLSQYLNQIKSGIDRKGFAAFTHMLFGPPKLHRDLLAEKDKAFCLAASPLDNNDPVHMRVLQTIYKKLTGSKFDCARYGGHWEIIGFQGSDPSTDLRGTGFLALLHLLHFLTDSKLYPLAMDIYKLSLHQTQNFPFCVMSINMTRIALQVLRQDGINKECNKAKSVMLPLAEFYTGLFTHLYNIWKTQHKTIADSGFVLKDLENSAKKNPRNVTKWLQTGLTRGSGKNKNNLQVDEEPLKFMDVCKE